MNEEELVGILKARVPVLPGSAGPGDDGAVLGLPPGKMVATTDTMIEGVDFFSSAPPEALATRLFTANLSDLAAMGASPHHFLLTLGLPDESFPIERFARALGQLARTFGIALAGGDLTRSDQILASITAIGVVPGGEPLLRTGSRPGDRIFVSRQLGGSPSGLELIRRGWDWAEDAPSPPAGPTPTPPVLQFAGRVLEAHLFPLPETILGVALQRSELATAAIDISDGLSTDLDRLCRASGVGADLEWERIPAIDGLETTGRIMQLPVERALLHGGEEYALLFTSTLRESELSKKVGRPVFAIGRIREGAGITLRSIEGERTLEPRGWDHFEAPS